MALRVTQSQLYTSSINNMNRNLSAMMESNLQASSQLRINRPSDDPVGAGRVISYRGSLESIDTYSDNCKAAMGWLKLSDQVIGSGDGSMQKVLTEILTLAEQGATATYTAEQRLGIASQVRQQFMQLINLANTEYNGRQLFSGHKTNQASYVPGLNVDSTDTAANAAIAANNSTSGSPQISTLVQGASESTVIIQSTSTGPLAVGSTFRYSNDGGKTWSENGTVTQPAGSDNLMLNAVDFGVTVTYTNAAAPGAAAIPFRAGTLANPASSTQDGDANGTWLYVRPTAIYQGDDDDTQVGSLYGATGTDTSGRTVTPSGTITGSYRNPVDVEITGVNASKWDYRYSTDGGTTWAIGSVQSGAPIPIPGGELTLGTVPAVGDTFNATATPTVAFGAGYPEAEGFFTRDVAVRIDKVDGGQISYSYSTDDGNNWTSSQSPYGGAGACSLPIPGGYLNFDQVPDATSQFVVHPHRADINFQISSSDSITVNMVGKDVFGGMYNYPGDGIKDPMVVTENPNMFEVVGKLIRAGETNSQAGFQEALAAIKEQIMPHILTKTAEIGGREDRLIVTYAALGLRTDSETEALSDVEDVDVTVLMTKLAQQQLAYNSVLKSSSMIMQLSLVNFL